jgi:hypothetical protein
LKLGKVSSGLWKNSSEKMTLFTFLSVEV